MSNPAGNVSLLSRLKGVQISRFQDLSAASSEYAIKETPVNLIETRPQIRSAENPGFSPQSLQELADSIQSVGQIQPIYLRPIEGGRFELIAGERRLRAVQLLQWPTIRALVREVDDQTAQRIQRIENLHRVGLEKLEEARMVQRDYQRLDRIADVAALWGKSIAWVHEAINYVAAIEQSSVAHEALQRGLTADVSTVTKLAALERDDPEIARATLDKLAREEGRGNVRATVQQATRVVKAARQQETESRVRKPSAPVGGAVLQSAKAATRKLEDDEPTSEDASRAVTPETVLANVYALQFGAEKVPAASILGRLLPSERRSLLQILAKAFQDGQRARDDFTRAIIQKGRCGEIFDDDHRIYRIVAFLEGCQGGNPDPSHLLRRVAEIRSR